MADNDYFEISGVEMSEDASIILYGDQEYIKPCGEFVLDYSNGDKSYCVKPVRHLSLLHEDLKGNVRQTPDICQLCMQPMNDHYVLTQARQQGSRRMVEFIGWGCPGRGNG